MAVPAFAGDCQKPGDAPAVPDGAKATMEQFKAAHMTIDAYVASVAAFRNCMAPKIAAAQAARDVAGSTKMRIDSDSAADTVKTLSDAYVDQVKIFKARTSSGSSASGAK